MKKLVLFVLVLAIFVCIGNVSCSYENEYESDKSSKNHESYSHRPESYIKSRESYSHSPESYIKSIGSHFSKAGKKHLLRHKEKIGKYLDKIPKYDADKFSENTKDLMEHGILEKFLSTILSDHIVFTAFFVGYMIFTTDILVSFRVELFISFVIYMILLAYDSRILPTGLLDYSVIYSDDSYMEFIFYSLEYFLVACLAYTVSCINGFYRYVIYLVYLVARFVTPRVLCFKLLLGIPLILIAWFLIIVFSVLRGDAVLGPFFYHLISSIPGLFFASLMAIIVAQRKVISQYTNKKKTE